MLTPARRPFVGLAVSLALVMSPVGAYADVTGTVTCEQHPTAPECLIDVVDEDQGDASPSSGPIRCHDITGALAPCYLADWGWNGGDGCYYKPASQEWTDSFGAPTPPAAWYEGSCVDAAAGMVLMTRMRVFGQPPGQALLVAEAVRRLRLPAPLIRVNPAPPAAQLVFVPTWLWLDPASWGRRSATATVPGLAVTATATPTRVVWSTGDGATITCSGPGTAWLDGADPMTASPDCGHTYTVASGIGTFVLRATITWSVSWIGGGLSGTVPALTSTATVPVRVAESLALNTSGG